jgi:WD40 repeat protein
LGAAALSADGQLAVSGSDDGTVRVGDLAAGTQRGAPLTGHNGLVLAVALSADGQIAVSGSDDGTMRVWDLAEAHCVLETVHDHAVTSIAVADTTRPAFQHANGLSSGAPTSWMLRLATETRPVS